MSLTAHIKFLVKENYKILDSGEINQFFSRRSIVRLTLTVDSTVFFLRPWTLFRIALVNKVM